MRRRRSPPPGTPTSHLPGLPHDGRQRQEHDHAQPDRGRAHQRGSRSGPPDRHAARPESSEDSGRWVSVSAAAVIRSPSCRWSIAPIVLVEQRGIHRNPTPPRSAMVHSFCGARKSLAQSARHGRVDGPGSRLGPDLCLRGEQEVLPGRWPRRGGRWSDDGHRFPDLEGLRRVDVLDVFAVPFDVDRFVLVADQHVAGTLQEDVNCIPARTGRGLDGGR